MLLFVCLFVGEILFVCTRIRERHGVFPANKIYTKPTHVFIRCCSMQQQGCKVYRYLSGILHRWRTWPQQYSSLPEELGRGKRGRGRLNQRNRKKRHQQEAALIKDKEYKQLLGISTTEENRKLVCYTSNKYDLPLSW